MLGSKGLGYGVKVDGKGVEMKACDGTSEHLARRLHCAQLSSALQTPPPRDYSDKYRGMNGMDTSPCAAGAFAEGRRELCAMRLRMAKGQAVPGEK